MDNFKANLLKGVSVGGIHCTCCNDCFGKSKKRLNLDFIGYDLKKGSGNRHIGTPAMGTTRTLL